MPITPYGLSPPASRHIGGALFARSDDTLPYRILSPLAHRNGL